MTGLCTSGLELLHVGTLSPHLLVVLEQQKAQSSSSSMNSKSQKQGILGATGGKSLLWFLDLGSVTWKSSHRHVPEIIKTVLTPPALRPPSSASLGWGRRSLCLIGDWAWVPRVFQTHLHYPRARMELERAGMRTSEEEEGKEEPGGQLFHQ
jgi:hypothetical protein